MKNIQLIASDLDGTLLLNGRSTPNDETLALIKKLTDKGYIFTVASGRQYENLRELFAPVRDDIAYLCCNGAICIYHGEVVCENYIDKSLANEIIRDIESTKDNCVMVSARGFEAISEKDERFRRYLIDFVKAKVRLFPDLTELEEKIFKVSLYNEYEQLNAEYWEERYKGRCEVLTSGNVWLDFIPFGSDKGTALAKFAQSLGIEREEIIAFGDNDNAISMLRYAGTPVTMNSAREEIRQYGAFSTDTVDEVLKKLV